MRAMRCNVAVSFVDMLSQTRRMCDACIFRQVASLHYSIVNSPVLHNVTSTRLVLPRLGIEVNEEHRDSRRANQLSHCASSTAMCMT